MTQEELKQWDEAGKTYDDYLKKYSTIATPARSSCAAARRFSPQKLYQPAAEWLAAAAARPGFDSADYATMRQAVALAQLGKQAEAGDLLAGIFTKFPNSTRFPVVLKTGHALARGLIRDKHPADAIALVEKLLPHAARARREAPLLLMDRADAAAAIPARRAESVALLRGRGEPSFPKDPVAPQALYLAGYGALTQGDYAATLQYADAFLAAYPKHELVPDVRYVAAESRLQLGKYDEAEKLYAELVARSIRSTPTPRAGGCARARRCSCRRNMRRSSPCCSPSRRRSQNADARAEAFYLIGSSLAEQKQFAEAVPALEAALAAAPKWRQADETLLFLGSRISP